MAWRREKLKSENALKTILFFSLLWRFIPQSPLEYKLPPPDPHPLPHHILQLPLQKCFKPHNSERNHCSVPWCLPSRTHFVINVKTLKLCSSTTLCRTQAWQENVGNNDWITWSNKLEATYRVYPEISSMKLPCPEFTISLLPRLDMAYPLQLCFCYQTFYPLANFRPDFLVYVLTK